MARTMTAPIRMNNVLELWTRLSTALCKFSMELADLNAGKSTKAVRRLLLRTKLAPASVLAFMGVNRFGAGVTNRQIAARGFSRVLIF
jgi:hypothetical protein